MQVLAILRYRKASDDLRGGQLCISVALRTRKLERRRRSLAIEGE
jgi:hypothetical protein